MLEMWVQVSNKREKKQQHKLRGLVGNEGVDSCRVPVQSHGSVGSDSQCEAPQEAFCLRYSSTEGQNSYCGFSFLYQTTDKPCDRTDTTRHRSDGQRPVPDH